MLRYKLADLEVTGGGVSEGELVASRASCAMRLIHFMSSTLLSQFENSVAPMSLTPYHACTVMPIGVDSTSDSESSGYIDHHEEHPD